MNLRSQTITTIHIPPPAAMALRTDLLAAVLAAVTLTSAALANVETNSQLQLVDPATQALIDTGYISLEQRLDDLNLPMPDGTGVSIGQVEAQPWVNAHNYMPDTDLPEFLGLSILDHSGFQSPAKTYAHATAVARTIYGGEGWAPRAAAVHVREAGDWIDSVIRPMTTADVDTVAEKVQNHSWISESLSPTRDADILDRLDLAIDRDDLVAVVAASANRADVDVPPLLASAYNAITVGVSSGLSAAGPTTFNASDWDTGEPLGPRHKPDIVAPYASTSQATAAVSGAAALLIDAADQFFHGDDLDAATHSQTVKALLLAGATKDEFDDWQRTPEHPLAPRFGAGELNIDNSHRVLTAGRFDPTQFDQQNSAESTLTRAPLAGWDYNTAAPDDPLMYYFNITPDMTLDHISIAATWHRSVEVGFPGMGGIPRLFDGGNVADINLELFALNEQGQLDDLVDSSVSEHDNVEHIYRDGLDIGHYALRVTTDRPEAFSMAWDFGAQTVRIAPIPQPQSLTTGVLGLALLAQRRRP